MTQIAGDFVMGNRRGIGMVDAIVSLLLLAMAGVIFSATFPSGFSAARQSGELKKAVALAQQKVEEVASLGYESLTYINLRSVSPPAIDESPSSLPYSFTAASNLSSYLASPTGTLAIADEAAGVKRITATISWDGGGVTRTVTIRTFVADKRPCRHS